MNDEKMIVGSLAMDLKRVALGWHRGSYTMAERFIQEAAQRITELHTSNSYLASLVQQIEKVIQQKNVDRIADDMLMYSTLLQNYVLTN